MPPPAQPVDGTTNRAKNESKRTRDEDAEQWALVRARREDDGPEETSGESYTPRDECSEDD
jgi:hypothetical protein